MYTHSRVLFLFALHCALSCLYIAVFRFEQKKIQKQAAAMMAVAVAEAEEKGADVTEMGNEVIVEVHRAEELHDLHELICKEMDPYVKAVVMPEGMSAARTKTHYNGGVAPAWDHTVGNELELVVSETTSAVKLEVW